MCLGIPGQIVERQDAGPLPMGVVDFGGVRRTACLAYVADEAQVGDYVIVHVGFAIAKVDEEEARRTWEALKAMEQLDELKWESELGEPRRPAPAATEGVTP